MARRPVFLPIYTGNRLVEERSFEFQWSPGFAESQKKKNVAALHAAANRAGIQRVLEISTKSNEAAGQRFSAFNLKLSTGGAEHPLESVYQGAKVFETRGPFPEIFSYEPREAKRFSRALSCGQLIGFELEGRRFPLIPKTAFYDWLYIRALAPHADWIEDHVTHDAYTDIEFNPEKQVNCQARAFAEYKSLLARSEIEKATRDFAHFASLIAQT